MGASLDKEAEEAKYVLPPTITQPLHHASQTAYQLKEIQSRELERDTVPTLRTFLEAVNMERIEYRLRIIGVYTLLDLANHTVDQLVTKGFTELMARRLQRAFDDYVSDLPVDGNERHPKTPFHVVRPNAVLPTTASTFMKKMTNYGRKSVKRTAGVVPAQRASAVIHLPTESTLPSFLLTQLYEREEDIDGGPKQDLEIRLSSRSQSVPTNINFDEWSLLSTQSVQLLSCSSAPVLAMCTTHTSRSSLEVVLSGLEEEKDNVEVILCNLYCLLDLVSVEENARKKENVQVIKRLVSTICLVVDYGGQCSEVIVMSCRVLCSISEPKLGQCSLAEKVVRMLASALRLHPFSSTVQQWASFTLYRIITNNKNLMWLVTECEIVRDALTRLPSLSDEVQVYLQQILMLAPP